MLLKFGRGAVFCAAAMWEYYPSSCRKPEWPPATPLTPRAAPLWWRESHSLSALQWTVNSQLGTSGRTCSGFSIMCVEILNQVYFQGMMKVMSNCLIVSRLGLANTRRSFGATASCLCQKQALHHSMNLLWAPKPLSKISSLKVTTLSHIKKFSWNPCKLIFLPRKWKKAIQTNWNGNQLQLQLNKVAFQSATEWVTSLKRPNQYR